MEAEWRKVRTGDLIHIIEIADLVHGSHPEDPAVFEERIRLFPDGCLALGYQGTLVGYAVSHPWHYGRPPALNTLLEKLPSQPSTYFIHDVAVHPRMQRLGYATKGFCVLSSLAYNRGLPNISLIALEASFGFWSMRGFVTVAYEQATQTVLTYGQSATLMRRDFSSN